MCVVWSSLCRHCIEMVYFHVFDAAQAFVSLATGTPVDVKECVGDRR